jgi:hypothetical protein
MQRQRQRAERGPQYRFLFDQKLDGTDRVGRLGLQTVDEALVALPLSALRIPQPFSVKR